MKYLQAARPDGAHFGEATTNDTGELQYLFPRGVVYAELSPLPETLPIHPLEAEAVRGVTSNRRREFAAGRWLAKGVLEQLGCLAAPLLSGPDKAPIWPKGIVGSISHSSDRCVVVAAKSPPFRSLGVDIEPMEPIEEELWTTICTDKELTSLREQTVADQGVLCKLIFSAKECLYKYQYPLTQQFLEFQDVEIRLDMSASLFEGKIVNGTQLAGVEIFEGRFRMELGNITTGMCSSRTL